VTKPRRVLVTGAGGEIGSATTTYLEEHGIRVTGLSLSAPERTAASTLIIGDATSPTDVASALEGVDAVVHLAAIPHPSLGTPFEVYRTNVTATFNVLGQAAELGVGRAVIASSINAFGIPFNPHRVFPAYFPLDEGIPTDIADAYSLSKQSDELTARMAARRWGIDVVAFRFPLVKEAETLREAAIAQSADPQLGVREGWSYLDVRDAVVAIYLALTEDISGAHVIGLSARDTLIDLPTEQLLADFAPDVPIRRRIKGTGTAIDTDRARALLGFEARHSVHDVPTDATQSSVDVESGETSNV
jgi:nucleoside-diphosphate-sugar epimerase